MSDISITSTHIKKIDHPIREIRERHLLGLISKLKCGINFDDELVRSKELFLHLLKWFDQKNPNYQKEVLEILYNILMSSSGLSLIEYLGLNTLIDTINKLKRNTQTEHHELIESMIKFIKKCQNFHNTESFEIPTLNMPISVISDIDRGSQSTFKHINDEISNLYSRTNINNCSFNNLSEQGVKLFLMPWCHLSESDLKKIICNEDCINVNESEERAIYFFSSILLKDFPPEVFLNRPSMITSLQNMLSNAKTISISTEALELYCEALNQRICELSDPILKNNKKLFNDGELYNSRDIKSSELLELSKEELIIDNSANTLKQMPLPYFCLDTLYMLINIIGRNDLQMRDMNMIFSLQSKLLDILNKIITNSIWNVQQANRFIQEIVQKIVVLFRTYGEVLNKLRLACLFTDVIESLPRVNYIRLLLHCISFMQWCKHSFVIPRNFVSSLYNSIADISFSISYSDHHKFLDDILQQRNFISNNLEDQNKMKLYFSVKEICESMNSAIQLLQEHKKLIKTIDILPIIKNSLLSLEFHKSNRIISIILDAFSIKILNWKLDVESQKEITNITIELLAHNCEWVQIDFYCGILSIVENVLSGMIKSKEETFNEFSIKFLFEPSILKEICAYGIESNNTQVNGYAKEIIQHLLRGKLLVSESLWLTLLESLIPNLPLLHIHATQNNEFGRSVMKTLDMKIGECMLIPRIEYIKGNLRLIYSKCSNAQMEGSKNILKVLSFQEEADNLLPKKESIISDLLHSALKTVSTKNFNINRSGDPNFYEEAALIQVMNLLRSNSQDPYLLKSSITDIDPSICKSALAQLAVILQQPNLHESFINNGGRELIVDYLRSSLTVNEFTTFPESAISCISMLNSLCYNNTATRLWASEQQNIYLYIIRAILLFPNEENFVTISSQTLSLLIFAHFTINNVTSHESHENANLSMHYSIVKRTKLPFKCSSHSKQSAHLRDNKEEWIMKQPLMSRYLRIHWCVIWYKGFNNVVKWPYVPESHHKESFSESLKLTDSDLTLLKITCPIQGSVTALYEIQNATSHKSVNNALDMLIGYIQLVLESNQDINKFKTLPWSATLRRFLITTPASPKDAELLLHFIKFLGLFLKFSGNDIEWITEPFLDCYRGIVSLLRNIEDDLYSSNSLIPIKLRERICHIISVCCSASNSPDFNDKINWSDVINSMTNSLTSLHIKNISSLAFTDQIIECLTNLTASPHNGIMNESELRVKLIKCLAFLCDSLYTKKEYVEYKGCSLMLNSMLVLCHLLEIDLEKGIESLGQIEAWVGNGKENILTVCLMQYNSPHVILRSLSFKLLSGLIVSESIFMHIENESKNISSYLIKIGIDCLCDLSEATLVREQAAMLILNLLTTKNVINKLYKHQDDVEDVHNLFDQSFCDDIVKTLTKVCVNEKDELFTTNNIPLDYLSNREHYEVAHSKSKINIPIKYEHSKQSKCSVKLLIGISDVIYNILIIYDDNKTLFESEIFKILFRCLLLKVPMVEDKMMMCSSICRTLYRASDVSEEVLNTIIETRDCVSALIRLFAMDKEVDGKNCSDMWKWSFLLMGNLFETQHGFKCVWSVLSESGMIPFLNSVLISVSNELYKDTIEAALYCLVNLLNSYTSYDADLHTIHLESLLDENRLVQHKGERIDDFRSDLISGESLCFYLIQLYKNNNQNNVDIRTKERSFDSIASGLCNLLGVSHKARMLAINKGFLKELIENLNEIQYHLITLSDQIDMIKYKRRSPILHYFNWTVLMICNIISNCTPAKEISVDYNLAVPVNKLWPWILSNKMLRFHAIQMLCSYTNMNTKANQSMCFTIGARSILNEIIDLVMKEMNLVSRKHSLITLSSSLQILENVCSHIHCRSIIIKSDLFGCLNKLHPAITKRQSQWKNVEVLWESFMNTITRYPEGQIKVAEYLGILCAFVHQADGLMLSILRNCAFNSHNRPRYLGSAEVINIFSNILMSDCQLSQKMDVCSTLWALCANSQKSKLSIKTSGLAAKMSDCLNRLKNSADNEREIQIVTYILKVVTVS